MAIGNLDKAINGFVLERMNDVGMNQPEKLSTAFADFEKAAMELKSKLPPDLIPLFLDCENTFSIFDAEIQEAYYRAGFADATEILMGIRTK